MRLPRVACFVIAILTCVASAAFAQQQYQAAFSFRAAAANGAAGWNGGPPETLHLDSAIFRSAPYAGRLDRTSGSPSSFSAYMLQIPITFAGDTIELRGWLRMKDVTGFAGLWLREDGPAGPVQFDNMQNRNLNGTSEWTQYSIRLPLDRHARTLVVGSLLGGTGTVWVDDLELLVDGKPASAAPPKGPASPQVAADKEFNAGSRITSLPVTARAVSNLALLGKVWGFAKYHHPAITGGKINWDYELFRIMPAVAAAKDQVTAARSLAGWLQRIGDPAPCAPCATVPADLQLQAPIEWINDTRALGSELSGQLQLIHRNRSNTSEQYYITQVRNVGNPDFSEESNYDAFALPDAGYRLLALYRFWNIVEYWFPYRAGMAGDWDAVLAEFVPRMIAASDTTSYHLALMELSARILDTHSNLWGRLGARPPRGPAQLPVALRFIENQAVVAGYTHSELGPATGLQRGDVIERIGGQRVDSLTRAWRPFYSASNDAARIRDMANALTRGPAGAVALTVLRDGQRVELNALRVPVGMLNLANGYRHDRPGDAFQRISDDVAYVKVSTARIAEVGDYMRRAAGAKVLVIDIRNYPGDFVIFALGSHLVTRSTPFARFTTGDLANPGSFRAGSTVSLEPAEPHFAGKVVVLVDEVTQSSAEYHAMAFRAAGALIVGSTTAGADGNVSRIPLPGGVFSMISGIGVFYPDMRPTQRIGIVPDVEVRPTIAGIKAGRDEVLEAAIAHALQTAEDE